MATKIVMNDVSIYYGGFKAVDAVSMDIQSRTVTAFIGPSGCGKSTVLRSLNRMHEVVRGGRIEGEIRLDGVDLYAPAVDPVAVRRTVGMVFQRPNPFPQSIYDNVAFGPRILSMTKSRGDLDTIVRESLEGAALWNEVKHRLQDPALELNPGQQQRLCIARTIAVRPSVILMDEPCSALDPVATLSVEELMRRLSEEYTIVIVTHNMQQAARASDYTGFFWLGELIEFGETEHLFSRPKEALTEAYITGRRG